ncbi:radical SAM family heme chaperone HemW [soil metagenome]
MVDNMSGIYIHIPFCRRKCTYCDFYLITNLNLIDRFTESLLREIELYSSKNKAVTFDTIFFGGGTPSLIGAEKLGRIISMLRSSFNISDDSEICIEANPEDLLNADIKSFRDAGINRISFGVQSFNNNELQFLTRNHTAEEALLTISQAQKYFDNISLDLIYSLPGQTIKDLTRSLEIAISTGVPHISAYTLIFEKFTRLYTLLQNGKVLRNNESTEADMYHLVSRMLNEAGYAHYEISNYSKQGYESRHNKKYWSYENYLGMGPSAHSMFNGKRLNNYRDIVKYNVMLSENRLPLEEVYELKPINIKKEFIMLALRSDGIHFERYGSVVGEDFEKEFSKEISSLISAGLGEANSKRLKLNEEGYLLADEIMRKYFNK